MVRTGIIRSPTVDELKDFKEIGVPTLEEMFRKKMVIVQQKFVKDHKPYCGRCAIMDFKDQIERAVKETERKHGEAAITDKTIVHIDKFDYEKYGSSERFRLLEETEIVEDKLLDGMRSSVRTGYYQNFMCKIRGCGHAVQVPLAIFEERKNKKSTSKKAE